MSFKKGIRNMLGLEDDEEDFYEDELESYGRLEPLPGGARDSAPKERTSTSTRRNLYPIAPAKAAEDASVSIVKPEIFDDAKEICDEMKKNRILVVNTTGMDAKVAQRLLDFICGASYNAGGDVQEIETGVYVLSPPMVEVTRNRQLVTKSSFLDFSK